MKIHILKETEWADFSALTQEYLPGSDQKIMRDMFGKYPNTFLVIHADKQLIGAAFGWKRSEAEFCLNGIAVTAAYWRKGLGTQLLSAFEKQAAGYGAKKVSVGSAEGDAEKFYLHNGYIPQCFKTNDLRELKSFDSLAEYYNYSRPCPGFVVMVKSIDDYSEM